MKNDNENKIVTEDKKSAAAEYNCLGGIAYQEDRDQEALELFQQAVKYDGSNEKYIKNVGLAYNALGIVASKAGDNVKGLALHLKALEYDNSNEEFQKDAARDYHRLGVAAYRAENYKEALDYYLKAVAYNDVKNLYKRNTAKAYYNLGEAAFKKREWKAALDYLLKAAMYNPGKRTYKKNLTITYSRKNDWDVATLIPRVAALIKNGDESGHLNYVLISMIALQKCNANDVLRQLALQEKLVIDGNGSLNITLSHIKVIDNILKGSASISYLSFSNLSQFESDAFGVVLGNMDQWKSVVYFDSAHLTFEISEEYKAEFSHYMHIPNAKPFIESPQLAALMVDAKEKKGVEILAKYDLDTLKQGYMGEFKCIMNYEGNEEVGKYMKSLIFNAAVAHLHLNSALSPKFWLPDDLIEHLLKTFFTIDSLCIMATGL